MVAVPQRQTGFTLMEVLVAMVVAAAAIAIFFQVFSASMKLELRARELMSESLAARQIFTQLQLMDIQADDFPWNGETGELRWQVRLEAVEVRQEQVEDGPVLSLPTELYKLEVSLSSQRGPRSRVVRYLALAPDALPEDFKARHVQEGFQD